ncbi:sensor histidine kinase [Salinimicrobium sp. GXAS 041]|uniref:sensor histidine kinase n=1 Tax=Salinimicrobium sp. GXAS 041 TaxID=3400806 RepID=UPI003C71083C
MSEIFSTKEVLQERVKELSCLYEISSIFREHQENMESSLNKICYILKQAWRFPEVAAVHLKLRNIETSTGEIETSTVKQTCNIFVFGKNSGRIEVHYPNPEFQEHHFLAEEQRLLDKVADEVSFFYEKQIHREKEELLKRAAQRNDRLSILGEITAGIAHELNTPLGNILGFAELINGHTQDRLVKADLSKIIKAAIYSREVVKKLMFFACEMPHNMKVVKVKPIISQALSLLGPNFRKAEVEYQLEFDDSSLEAQLDPIQLTQVMFNLLINALYLSPKDSVIKIHVYNDEESLFIEIADEGPGIKKEHKSKIFEPFFTTKPVGEGSGLGLSVVHGIIKSHRGNIRAFENKPKGTIFQIQLPLKF